jgi:hypothetical protein
MNNIIVTHQDMFGALWSIGWLFTVGFLRLRFWKGVLAIFIWPYYIGMRYSAHAPESKMQ